MSGQEFLSTVLCKGCPALQEKKKIQGPSLVLELNIKRNLQSSMAWP